MNHNDLIFKYLNNKLSHKEQLTLEKLILTDSAFKEELNFQKNLKKVTVKEDEANFRKLIQKIENQASSKTISKKLFIKWMAVASVIFLLGLSYMLIPQQKMSNETIFTSYFKPYKNVIAPIVRGENKQNEKTLAFMAYEKGNYETAVMRFTELYKDTKEPFYLFYKANALLQLERTEEAIPLLINHLKTKDTLTKKTNWYLALAYLKSNKTKKAKNLLKKIIDLKSYNYKKAEELIKKIK